MQDSWSLFTRHLPCAIDNWTSAGLVYSQELIITLSIPRNWLLRQLLLNDRRNGQSIAVPFTLEMRSKIRSPHYKYCMTQNTFSLEPNINIADTLTHVALWEAGIKINFLHQSILQLTLKVKLSALALTKAPLPTVLRETMEIPVWLMINDYDIPTSFHYTNWLIRIFSQACHRVQFFFPRCNFRGYWVSTVLQCSEIKASVEFSLFEDSFKIKLG